MSIFCSSRAGAEVDLLHADNTFPGTSLLEAAELGATCINSPFFCLRGHTLSPSEAVVLRKQTVVFHSCPGLQERTRRSEEAVEARITLPLVTEGRAVGGLQCSRTVLSLNQSLLEVLEVLEVLEAAMGSMVELGKVGMAAVRVSTLLSDWAHRPQRSWR